jgi:PmbA protein
LNLARRCEQAAFAVSPQISNSEGATVSIQEGQFVSANSLGFIGGYPSSRHYLSCSVIAGKNESMQRDDWYSVARDPLAIGSAESIGERAARRALSRLGACKIKTCKVPVIFEAPLAASLIGNFVHAVSGGSLYRKTSFLVDSLGRRVFSKKVQISERPHLAWRWPAAISTATGWRPRIVKCWSTAAAGLFPERLQRAQAGHADHRQRRRLPQPHRPSRQARSAEGC